MILKSWNKSLASSKNSRLNSFSIYMMLLAYMLHNRMLVNLQLAASYHQTVEVDVYIERNPYKIQSMIQFVDSE